MPFTPLGNPVTVAPVPPPLMANVIVLIAVLMHLVRLFEPPPEVKAIAAFGLTIIVPVAVAWPQGPVVVIV